MEGEPQGWACHDSPRGQSMNLTGKLGSEMSEDGCIHSCFLPVSPRRGQRRCAASWIMTPTSSLHFQSVKLGEDF